MPIDLLIAALSADHPDRRAEAAEQLAQLGAEAQSAAVALVRACGDEAEEVRQWAAAALESLGPPAASDAGRLAALLGARSPDVGYWAATLLGRLQGEARSTVETLAAALVGPADVSVRQRVAWALGEIGPGAIAAAAALQMAAGSPDPRLARLAAESLRKIQ